MKANKVLFWGAMALALSFTACGDDDENKPEEQPTEKSLVAPILTLSSDNLTLEETDAAAITLNWTNAAADIEGVEASYKLYINLASKDIFSEPFSLDLGKVQTFAVTGKVLNTALVTVLKIGYGETVDVKVAIYATASGYEAVTSEAKTLSVTTARYFPPSLVMVGDAMACQWDLAKGTTLNSSSTGVYEAKGIEMLIGPAVLNYGVKLYFGDETGENARFLGEDPAAENFGKLAIFTDGDHKISLADAGYTTGTYDVTMDMNTMQLSLTRTGNINFDMPDEIYMVGDAVPWRWDWESPDIRPLTATTPGGNVYTMTDVVLNFGNADNPVGFKVVPRFNNYVTYYAYTGDYPAQIPSVTEDIPFTEVLDTDLPQFYPSKLGYTNGTYTITMDFGTMKLKLEKTVIAPMWIYGPATPGGWGGPGVEVPHKSGKVWEKTDVPLTKMEGDVGFKVFPGYQVWNPRYLQEIGGESGVMHEVADDAEETSYGDSRFDVTATGNYTVTIDMDAKKVSLTKTGDIPVGPMWIYGPSTPNSWDGNGVEIPHKSGNIWEATGVALTCDPSYDGFKVYNGFKAWWPYYRQDQTAGAAFGTMYKVETQEQQTSEGDFLFPLGANGFTTGNFTVTIDMDQMKISVVAE